MGCPKVVWDGLWPSCCYLWTLYFFQNQTSSCAWSHLWQFSSSSAFHYIFCHPASTTLPNLKVSFGSSLGIVRLIHLMSNIPMLKSSYQKINIRQPTSRYWQVISSLSVRYYYQKIFKEDTFFCLFNNPISYLTLFYNSKAPRHLVTCNIPPVG